MITGIHNVAEDKWVVRLSRDSDIDAFYRIETIFDCKVRLRRDRGRDVVQCYRCQRFGRVSINCGMPVRCVKCGEAHESREFSIPSKAEMEKLESVTGEETALPTNRCVNCKVDGHSASSTECPLR